MNKVPTIPPNSFAHDYHCHYPSILKNGKTIRIISFIRQNIEDWESPQELLEWIVDFDKWDEYAKAGDGAIRFRKSLRLAEIKVDGVKVMQHYSDLIVQGPLGVKQHIVALNHVKRVSPYEGASLSLEFELAPSDITEIQGIGPYKPRGVRNFQGNFHILTRTALADYVIATQVDIWPTDDFGPNIAIDYVRRAGESMVKGMFAL